MLQTCPHQGVSTNHENVPTPLCLSLFAHSKYLSLFELDCKVTRWARSLIPNSFVRNLKCPVPNQRAEDVARTGVPISFLSGFAVLLFSCCNGFFFHLLSLQPCLLPWSGLPMSCCNYYSDAVIGTQLPHLVPFSSLFTEEPVVLLRRRSNHVTTLTSKMKTELSWFPLHLE